MSKKRAAIFGAGNAGRYLYDEIKENVSEYGICVFLDNNVYGEYKGKNCKAGLIFCEEIDRCSFYCG